MGPQDVDGLGGRLRRHVDVLAELIGERNTAHPSALVATRAYLRRELAVMRHPVVDQPFAVYDRAAVNLEVRLPGIAAGRPTLVIGAHYDSAAGTPGADDNASAVTILLEIARGLAGRSLRRPVRIVFFDCEEPPYFNTGEMGSQHHAAVLGPSGEAVLGMVYLESLGYFPAGRTGPGAGPVPWPVRWFGRAFGQRYVVVVSDVRSAWFGWRFLWRFATSGTFPFLPAAMPVAWVPEIALSDHRGSWEQGMAAIMVTDTALLRNPHYHRPTDRLATLDVPRMAKLCRQLQRTVRRMTA